MSHGGETHHNSLNTYGYVCIALFALTILTAVCYFLHLGAFAAPVAVLIATTKAALVIMYFMHMRHDSGMNRLIFGLAFFFVGLLFLFCALDIFTRIKELPTL